MYKNRGGVCGGGIKFLKGGWGGGIFFFSSRGGGIDFGFLS